MAGTPQRVASPSAAAPSGAGSMADMIGLFDTGVPQSNTGGSHGQSDFADGFAGLDLGGANNQPPSPQTQLQHQGSQKKTTEDLLGMF